MRLLLFGCFCCHLDGGILIRIKDIWEHLDLRLLIEWAPADNLWLLTICSIQVQSKLLYTKLSTRINILVRPHLCHIPLRRCWGSSWSPRHCTHLSRMVWMQLVLDRARFLFEPTRLCYRVLWSLNVNAPLDLFLLAFIGLGLPWVFFFGLFCDHVALNVNVEYPSLNWRMLFLLKILRLHIRGNLGYWSHVGDKRSLCFCHTIHLLCLSSLLIIWVIGHSCRIGLLILGLREKLLWTYIALAANWRPREGIRLPQVSLSWNSFLMLTILEVWLLFLYDLLRLRFPWYSWCFEDGFARTLVLCCLRVLKINFSHLDCGLAFV